MPFRVSGVDRLSGRPNGKPLLARKIEPLVGRPSGYPFQFETHGPYTAFLGNPWYEGYHQPRPFMMNDTVMSLAAETPPQARENCNCAGKDCDGPSACERYATPALTGAGEEGWYRSEFGATSWPSFESVSANLPQEQWGMSTAAGALRNWNVSNVIYTFFGTDAVASGMKQSGEVAFKRQLYQSALGQLLFLKTEIESWRSSNVWGTTFWMFNEVWPCASWGSIEYGPPDQPGQLLGGRWRPLHYQLRSSTFADQLSTCNTGGACFLTNSSPFAFKGEVSVRLLNVLSGKSAQLKGIVAELPPGAGVTKWFCASGMQESTTAKAIQSATLPTKYTVRSNMLPTARGLHKGTLVGSLAQCEAACDKQPHCQGFTHGTTNPAVQKCYFYYHVKSLAASPGVEWFQKPSVDPFPCPKGCAKSTCVCPGPAPPLPPSPPPPPQLKCLAWAESAGWKAADCDGIGTNCVLDISVKNSSGIRVSHNVNPFVAPKHMAKSLPKAAVSFTVGASGAITLKPGAEARL